MSRLLLVPLAALVLVPLGCARTALQATDEVNVTVVPGAGDPPADGVAVAPMPRAVTRLPVAPMPHEAREPDLTNTDPGLDVALPSLERIENVPPPGPVNAPDAIVGVPGVPVRRDDPPAAPSFPGRTGATKSRLLKEGGGNAESERAVALGLAWLAKQQKQDGGWEFEQGEWKDDRIAATGLALLPYLAAGCSHKATIDDHRGKYQKTVALGLDFLKKACATTGPKAGRFEGATTIGQALATIALCDAYGLTREPVLKPYAQAAINAIQDAQAKDGGWSDKPDGKSDLTVAGWQIQALQAAKLTKEIVVADRVVTNAIKFLNTVAGGARKSMYGTTDNADAKPGTAATATGLLCRYYIDGWGPSHPGFIDGTAGLAKNGPIGKGALRQMDYFYYATQVVHFYEGEDWKTWNEGPKQADGTRKGGMRDWLVAEQNRKDGATLGSWDPEAGTFGKNAGRLGTTAACVLTLEVYYRHLPLYKRGADGNAVKILEDK